MSTIGRNDACPCGSGKKYKKCCLSADELERRQNSERDPHFIAELRPDLDKSVDRLLERLERGEGQAVGGAIAELVERYPGYHMTNYAMGVYLATVEEDHFKAISFFEQAVAIYPPFAEAHFNLGMSARKVYDIAKSAQAFRAAAHHSGGDEIGRMARKELRWFEDTLRDTTSFATLDAYLANANLFDRAFDSLRKRQFAQAAELFQQVLKENPRHIQSHGNLGIAYAALGRRADALMSYDRALEIDPSYEPARVNRAIAEAMREGEAAAPDAIEEVEFYRDRLRGQTLE